MTVDNVPVYNQTNGNNNWATPRDFLSGALRSLGHNQGVGLDLAASNVTKLALAFLGPNHPVPSRRDALDARADWNLPGGVNGVRYLNCPYGRLCTVCEDKVWKGKPSGLPKEQQCASLGHVSSTVLDWMKRAAHEGVNGRGPLIVLVPSRTDTEWWHDYVQNVARRVFFVNGRLRFLEEDLQPTGLGPAPFPSALLEYIPGWRGQTMFGALTPDGALYQRAFELPLQLGEQ